MSIKVKKGATANVANENQPLEKAAAAIPTQIVGALKPLKTVIENHALAELTANPRNARTHSKKQVQQLAASIKEFGFLVPIVVDEECTILAGHGRVEAAKLLKMTAVPTVAVKHLTPSRKRAFALADNRLAELATWDEELLAIELKELAELELDFAFEVTGFETVDLDRIEGTTHSKKPTQEVVPELDRTLPPVSAVGDLWQLGDHRLLCGSALEAASYQRLLSDERVQLVFSDPPYNVKIDGHVCGLGSVKHEAFKMASGEMSKEEFTSFLQTAMRLMADYSVDGAIHYICMDWRHMTEMLAATDPIYGAPKNLCVWNKTNAGMGTFYRSKHELVFVFKCGTAPHINNFGLGDGGRYRSNVWDYEGVNTFKRGRMEELSAHPTVKPLALVVDALKDCSKRRGIVLDPFLGSGTTLLAAEKTGRYGRGIELDPQYVDATIRRWQTLSGQAAVHVESGRTFDELAARQDRDAA
ncbi:site-specific DNA-methyltransferase [Reyranella soli]|uniref:Methyltransferase n=1 Tax=Reyranella soli TaxID=1230389 RepID=A0A512NT64_9HYPH|nr:DNA methyltransferase [Reyranella soli]GEP62153.1 methyltransferase [Reyranella soli]